jgi:hypothetical protein
MGEVVSHWNLSGGTIIGVCFFCHNLLFHLKNIQIIIFNFYLRNNLFKKRIVINLYQLINIFSN